MMMMMTGLLKKRKTNKRTTEREIASTHFIRIRFVNKPALLLHTRTNENQFSNYSTKVNVLIK